MCSVSCTLKEKYRKASRFLVLVAHGSEYGIFEPIQEKEVLRGFTYSPYLRIHQLEPFVGLVACGLNVESVRLSFFQTESRCQFNFFTSVPVNNSAASPSTSLPGSLFSASRQRRETLGTRLPRLLPRNIENNGH